MSTFSNPKRIYENNDNLYVVYGTSAPYTTSSAFDLSLGVKMNVYEDSGTLTIDIEDNASSITSPTVTSSMKYEDAESKGEIRGGKLEYSCGSGSNIDLKGETSAFDYTLELGIDEEFHMGFVGTDDIRAREGVTNFGQIFAAQDQEIYMRLSGSSTKTLDIEYKHKSA